MAIIISVGYTTPPGVFAERREASVSLTVSKPPKVGEVFKVSCTFTLKVPPESTSTYPHKVRFNVNIYPEKDAYKIVDGQLENKLPELSKGMPVTFNISVVITKPVMRVQITGGIPGHLAWGKSCEFYLIDPETGQYGTKEEYEGNLPVEYRYEPVDGSFTCSPSQNPAPVEENRRIIKMIRELEPRLSDSLALLLHSDQYRVGVPKGVPRWDSLNQRWIDKGVYEYYLKDGWLKALQEGKRDEWLKKEKAKIEQGWKGGSLNFFRPGDNYNITGNSGGNSYPPHRVETTFTDRWFYKTPGDRHELFNFLSLSSVIAITLPFLPAGNYHSPAARNRYQQVSYDRSRL